MRPNGYGTTARTLPAYIALAPAGVLAGVMMPLDTEWWVGVAGAGVALGPIAYALGQVSADMGKRLEKRLWLDWGGPPVTSALRHSSGDMNAITRERVHQRLRALGLHVPTRDEETEDPGRADTHYEACTGELIRRARDRKNFPLIHQGLTEYGYRRNLLGVKPIGVIVAAIVAVVTVWLIPIDANTGAVGRPDLWLPGVAGILALVFWFGWVNEGAVKMAADRYTRSLLEAGLTGGKL